MARAIFACPIPVVSGVGHEVDFTIADFVADERAPTPSGAAERVVPDRAEWLRALGRHRAGAWRSRCDAGSRDQRQALQLREQRLARAHPGAVLRQHAQRLDELEGRLRLAARAAARARSRAGYAPRTRCCCAPRPRCASRRSRLRLDAARRGLAGAARGRVVRGTRRRFELARARCTP